jgi:hypothetical protein
VRWWCDHFGVTHHALYEAIAAVGLSAVAVRMYLERRCAAGGILAQPKESD